MIDIVQGKADEVAELMKTRLGIRGADLAAKLRHTGRLLPRHIKRDAAALAQAAALAENPKLHKRIDLAQVKSAYKNCVQHLEAIDVSERNKGIVLGILSSLALAFLVIAGLVVTVLAWRGYL